MKIRVMCQPQGLVPLFDDDYDNKQRLKEGATYEVNVREIRNPRFHNLVMTMLKRSWELCLPFVREGFHDNFDSWRKTVLLAAGCSERVYSIERQEFIETYKSISFDKMSETEFHSYFERIKDVLYTVFLNHLPKETKEQLLDKW